MPRSFTASHTPGSFSTERSSVAESAGWLAPTASSPRQSGRSASPSPRKLFSAPPAAPSIGTSALTRPGACRYASSEVWQPIECATSTALGAPAASATRHRSLAQSATVVSSGRGGIALRPCPR